MKTNSLKMIDEDWCKFFGKQKTTTTISMRFNMNYFPNIYARFDQN